MALTLEGPWRKYQWAEQHYEPLWREIEAFEQSHAYRIRCDIDEQVGQYSFYVGGLQPVNNEWGLQVGDIVHHLRTALDYLAVQLVALCTGNPSDTLDFVDFPICSAPGSFIDWRNRLIAAAKKRDLPTPLLGGYLTRLEELQPYNAGDPSIWGSENMGWATVPAILEHLGKLDNADKHRGIHPTWHGVDWLPSTARLPRFPDGFREMGTEIVNNALDENAYVGHWRFVTPLPSKWEPGQMEMKRAFPLQVCVGYLPLLQNVREVLSGCFVAVADVLHIFEPVFGEHGAPPLAVTTTLRARPFVVAP